jgi:hypothetical protein
MHLFFYAVRPSQQAVQCYRDIAVMDSVPECIALRTGCALNMSSVQQMTVIGDVFLIFVEGVEDIEHLQQFSEYFEDFFLILVLGNPSRSLLDKSYILRPRFICHGQKDLGILKQVLSKMFTVSIKEDTDEVSTDV